MLGEWWLHVEEVKLDRKKTATYAWGGHSRWTDGDLILKNHKDIAVEVNEFYRDVYQPYDTPQQIR
jgi:hypothetical protein